MAFSSDALISERMMLRLSLIRDGEIILRDTALNDVVVHGYGECIQPTAWADGKRMFSFSGDGLIAATPTGSTGYSLSAGGPIVAPDASLILLTALAPHTLASRPVILPDHVAVTVEVAENSVPAEDGAAVVFDGDTSISLDYGSRIRIMKTEQKTRLVKIKHTSFVEILREKLK